MKLILIVLFITLSCTDKSEMSDTDAANRAILEEVSSKLRYGLIEKKVSLKDIASLNGSALFSKIFPYTKEDISPKDFYNNEIFFYHEFKKDTIQFTTLSYGKDLIKSEDDEKVVFFLDKKITHVE